MLDALFAESEGRVARSAGGRPCAALVVRVEGVGCAFRLRSGGARTLGLMRKPVVAVLVGLVVALVAVFWQGAAASSPDRPAPDRSVVGHERTGLLERAEGRPGKGRKDRAGGTVVVGTVKAVRDGALDVAKDAGGEVTVTTGPSTKTRGVDLAGLRPGQRVIVRAQDGKALMVGGGRGRAPPPPGPAGAPRPPPRAHDSGPPPP
ncbi:hypothetical protein ACFXGA_05030, partial [Actinosynnema sp. NPDC059335]|uniref:hypothetical protein n=1 Tax=Actinosynnema sp. NPDC059335 TaxID=3346804 RepID=UPI00366AEC33